jgi:hypothetical protein
MIRSLNNAALGYELRRSPSSTCRPAGIQDFLIEVLRDLAASVLFVSHHIDETVLWPEASLSSRHAPDELR